MQQVTVRELKEYCEAQIRKGNGNKNIVISDDNEGNGYHGLFYGFTEFELESGFQDEIYDSMTTEPEDTIILG